MLSFHPNFGRYCFFKAMQGLLCRGKICHSKNYERWEESLWCRRLRSSIIELLCGACKSKGGGGCGVIGVFYLDLVKWNLPVLICCPIWGTFFLTVPGKCKSEGDETVNLNRRKNCSTFLMSCNVQFTYVFWSFLKIVPSVKVNDWLKPSSRAQSFGLPGTSSHGLQFHRKIDADKN